MKKVCLSVALLLVVLFGFAAQAEAGTYTVSGKVFESDGVTPIPATTGLYGRVTYFDSADQQHTLEQVTIAHDATGAYTYQAILTDAHDVSFEMQISYKAGKFPVVQFSPWFDIVVGTNTVNWTTGEGS